MRPPDSLRPRDAPGDWPAPPAAACQPPGPAGSLPDAGQSARLSGREVLVCVCGGIAAYKTAALVSMLVQRGCGVTVAMTRNAQRFVGEVTFRALTGRRVYTSPWSRSDPADIQHLELARAADAIVVAPATANVLGKLASGIADDLVSSLLLGADCPVILAPAMNERMWRHPSVQRNVAFLQQAGLRLVGPESGWQACRTVGQGRMSEPEVLLQVVVETLHSAPARMRSGRQDT